MIGCNVTTLMKIERIQKEAKRATFWMRGIGATATSRMPRPSVMIDAIAGAKRLPYEVLIASSLSCNR